MRDFDFAFHIVGGREALSEADAALAAVAFVRVARATSAPILLAMDGYDDDPRELWEVAEVCFFLQNFVLGVVSLPRPRPLVPRLTDEAIALLWNCAPLRPGPADLAAARAAYAALWDGPDP